MCPSDHYRYRYPYLFETPLSMREKFQSITLALKMNMHCVIDLKSRISTRSRPCRDVSNTSTTDKCDCSSMAVLVLKKFLQVTNLPCHMFRLQRQGSGMRALEKQCRVERKSPAICTGVRPIPQPITCNYKIFLQVYSRT